MRHLMVVGAILAPATLAIAQCPPQHLIPPHPWAFGEFGRALAMGATDLVVGDRSDAELCPVTQDCAAGAAHIYRFDEASGAWTLRQTLRPPSLESGFGFGKSVGVNGDRMIVGAPGALAGTVRGGAAYVFDREGSTWVETGLILPEAPISLGQFGQTVAIDASFAIVGRPRGHETWVYALGPGGWQFAERLAPGAAEFGSALALSEDWLFVGAPGESSVARANGAVFVYRRGPGAELTLTQKLLPPDAATGPYFGRSIAVDGATLAVGGPDSNRTYAGQGAVYVFELIDGRWELRDELTHDNPAGDDELGAAVSISDEIIVAGAPGHRGLWPPSGGAAYVFTRQTDGSWAQAAELRHGSPETGPYGKAVAVRNRCAVVGSPGEPTAGPDGGAVYIFDLECMLCRADLDGDGELTFFDFLAFGNLFAAGDLRADFDGSGALDLFDFLAFQTAFAAGCP